MLWHVFTFQPFAPFRLATLMPATNLSALGRPTLHLGALRPCITPFISAMAGLRACTPTCIESTGEPGADCNKQSVALVMGCMGGPPRSLECFLPPRPSLQRHCAPRPLRSPRSWGWGQADITIERCDPRRRRPPNRDGRSMHTIRPGDLGWLVASAWIFLQLSKNGRPAVAMH